ncbi:conserved protein of unknown function [Rhodovastum atsumiense]|uniref:Uncharacterized protein n=1 Tax=Rhodovastum atsumiense TaxID=504468 RepID=A0A5M6IY42_9PROT|nr:hypothetical protein [Rhodovastum atsumiense]KAA5613244.1 hypothetical protein F1189_06000 [Rhodovastum atsumiense]CAH2600598.1 conserved protein of unknown function [Rhodovastum atsumiense]
MPELRLSPPRHERQDVGPRFALTVAAGLIAVLLVVAGLAGWLYPAALHGRQLVLPAQPHPPLQSSPRRDMQRFRQEELQQLNSAGLIDREHGIVHIPIDAAMDRIAAEGIPGWPGR